MTPLRQQLINFVTLKGYSKRTEQSYVESMAALATYYHCSPELLDDRQLEAYLLHLHVRGYSASTLNVRLSGLRFFYARVLERPFAVEALPRPAQPTPREAASSNCGVSAMPLPSLQTSRVSRHGGYTA